ncbi:MAG: twin-arginine translocation signal domain-containing protein [Planctomycetes bacterium]|nr:twin-arginine translocation signal domain-containing protein [Planctomycetota bacterium]
MITRRSFMKHAVVAGIAVAAPLTDCSKYQNRWAYRPGIISPTSR